jgi:hypothetical protein
MILPYRRIYVKKKRNTLTERLLGPLRSLAKYQIKCIQNVDIYCCKTIYWTTMNMSDKWCGHRNDLRYNGKFFNR